MKKFALVICLTFSALLVFGGTGLPRTIKNYTDPLDKTMKSFLRNKDESVSQAIMQRVYSFKIIRIIGYGECIATVRCHSYARSIYHASANEGESIVFRQAYIRGFDLTNFADGDVIWLGDSQTAWRVGAYKNEELFPGQSLPKFTMLRTEAVEFANSIKHKKKKVKNASQTPR